MKARATTRFLWWTLHLTRDAAEAALLPSRSRKPGTGYGRRLAISRLAQGTEGKVCQSAARSYRSSTQPRQRAAEPRGSVSAFRPARRSAAGLCRTSTRSFRRGPSRGRRRKPEFVGDDGGRRRVTSWRTARAGRGCVGGRWCARQTGGGQPVEVRRKEGVTDHLHPESCAGRCEAAGEALTGARTDGAIEHRKQEFWSAETVTAVEGHTDITATGEGMKGSCARLTGEG